MLEGDGRAVAFLFLPATRKHVESVTSQGQCPLMMTSSDQWIFRHREFVQVPFWGFPGAAQKRPLPCVKARENHRFFKNRTGQGISQTLGP